MRTPGPALPPYGVYRWLLLITAGLSASTFGAVNLEWRPPLQTVGIGQTVNVGLYAVSDDPLADQPLAGIDLIFAWDPAVLQLLAVDDTGAEPLQFSGFSADPFALNEVIPPQDGDGLYQALALLGVPVQATPGGVLITTFRFLALDAADATTIDMLPAGGTPTTQTVVWDGLVPNHPVTGTLDAAGVTVVTTVPAASQWGITAMVLLLTISGTVIFGRCRSCCVRRLAVAKDDVSGTRRCR